MNKSSQNFINSLVSLGMLKFGEFKLKSGKISPYYVDLRILISYPSTLSLACNLLYNLFKNQQNPKPNLLCGITAAGVPIATILAQKLNLPLITNKKEPIYYKELVEKIRSEITNTNKNEFYNTLKIIESFGKFKGHGLNKYVDGYIQENSRIGLIDDLITTAKSKIEVKELLMLEKDRVGLKNIVITDVYVLLDREQGGSEILNRNGLKLHSVFKITDVINHLYKNNTLNSVKYNAIMDYIVNEKSYT
ncbi:MAG TPA: hypothetical protein VJ583_09335 [Nitrososphaeraceae archaeon]|nr:hypothetical protein [Nitrososphaeraceae archaeon]